MIRPIGRLGGLDKLHVTLLAVIVILVLLVAVVSYSKPVTITKVLNCSYGIANSSCVTPTHNSTVIEALAERVLASYASVNSSLSLLPYISNVSSLNVTYLPQGKEWLASLKVRNFGSNTTLLVSFLVSDINTSVITPLIQTVRPSLISNNSVVAYGVVKLSGKYSCLSASSTSVYWFIDPYAPGALKSLSNATALENSLGSRINLTVKIVSGADTQRIAIAYGADNAQILGRYTFCASQQKGFNAFVSNLNSLFSGSYMSSNILGNIANFSSLNTTALNACVNASVSKLNAQALLASYYNITQTPVAIVNCNYMALPQTAKQAICYVNKTTC